MPHGSGQRHPRQALKTQSGIKAIGVPKPRRSRPCPTPELLFLPRDLLRTPGARWPPPPVHLRHSRAAEIPEANLAADVHCYERWRLVPFEIILLHIFMSHQNCRRPKICSMKSILPQVNRSTHRSDHIPNANFVQSRTTNGSSKSPRPPELMIPYVLSSMDIVTESHMAPPKSSMPPIPTAWLQRVVAPVRRPRGQSRLPILAERREAAEVTRFGAVVPIPGSDFMREMSQASLDVWVVVILYKE
ncbi:hypothetical protein PS2_028595 [Malus domestica]